MESKAVVFLPLSQGKVAVIDFDDFEKVRPYKWHAVKRGNNWYARHNWRDGCGGFGFLFLHRFLLATPSGQPTDHIDGDGLNNQRNNLRICSVSQNAHGARKKMSGTSSKFIGVSRNNRPTWVASITVEGKKFPLGRFVNEEDAARAYDAKSRELFGEHATTNFPI